MNPRRIPDSPAPPTLSSTWAAANPHGRDLVITPDPLTGAAQQGPKRATRQFTPLRHHAAATGVGGAQGVPHDAHRSGFFLFTEGGPGWAAFEGCTAERDPGNPWVVGGGGGLDCHHPHVCSCFFPGSVNGFFAFLIKRPVRGGHKTSSKMKIWHKGSTLGNSIM